MKHPPSILIVDDTPENLLFLKALMNKLNINLIQAYSGTEALEKINGVELALAIIDVHMPGMNGYELSEKINQRSTAGKVPVIFVTAIFFDEKEIFKGYNSGAVDYIFKPIDRHILLSKINVFLDLYEYKQTVISNAVQLKKYAEKLVKANTALQKSDAKYKSYIENAPDGVFVTDKTGKYLEVNEAASRISGHSKNELIGMSMSDMLIDKPVENIAAFFNQLDKKGSYAVETEFKHKNGSKRWMTISAVQLSKKLFLGFVKDITDNKFADVALKESEDRFRSFFELTADLMVISDTSGYFKDINSSWSHVLGFSKEEFLGKPFFDFIHPDDVVKTKTIITEKINRGSTVLSFENRYLKKGGGIVWLEWTSQLNTQKGQIYAIARDITARKNAEAELQSSLEQLHALTIYIEKVRENERIIISRELHDDLGQALTAVKIDLGLIKNKVSDTNTILRIEKVSALVSDTIKTVQRLTSQLRPQIIDDLGLNVAIEWHVKEFTERTGIEVFPTLNSSLEISAEASLTVFRIMQESLTNIARHSKATKVNISLFQNGDYIQFRIADNGIGITENETTSKKSFGLLGMKERASSLGGTLNIYNENGQGTVIMLIFPKQIEQITHENSDL